MLTFENRKTIKCAMSIGFVLALALLVYYSFYPALDNLFVGWDDQFYVTLNPLITNPTWSNLKELWSVIISLNYHPMTMSSIWLNSYYSGVDSAYPYILTNIIIHFCNTVLVYYMLTKLFDKSIVLSIFVALVFAIHPMHVESVVWVSERKDVLYAFFFFASILSYLKYVDTEQNKFYALSILLFVFSCLSKAMAVSLVPVLFLVDFIRYKKINSQNLQTKLPFLFIGLLIGGIAINIQSGGDALGMLNMIANEKAIEVNVSVSFWERLSYGSYSLMFYVIKFFWPYDLAAFHPYDGIIDGHLFMYSPIVFVGLFFFAILTFRKNKMIFFGLSFFICTIVLVSQFLPVGSALVAERYSYLPYIGLSIPVGYVLQKLYDQYSKLMVMIFLFIATTSMVFLTRKQSDVWQDQVSLFSQVVDRYPENYSSRHYLATGYWQQGNYDNAIRHLKYAIDTLHGITDQNFELLANSYAELGDTVKAIAFYNKAVDLNPDNLIARYHRALLLVDVDPSQVVQDLTICEQSDNIYVNQFIFAPRGRAYGLLGNYRKAIKDFKIALKLAPQDIWNYYDLGLTYELNNEFDKAIKIYQESKDIDPNFELISARIKTLNSILQ